MGETAQQDYADARQTFLIHERQPFPTPRDAEGYDYLSKTVPKAELQHRKVLVAATCLANAAEGRDQIMHARIATRQALQRNDAPPAFTDRKETHWGKRRLKRDE